jgi:FAD synthase
MSSPTRSLNPFDPARILQGHVVRGLGRGRELLGIPTANIPIDENQEALESLGTGIYIGWSKLGESITAIPTVLSIGWNPHFHNPHKTIEPHLLHDFDKDFYGELLKVSVAGFIRPQESFSCLNDLIAAIHGDIDYAKEHFADPAILAAKNYL